ncbi:MAG: protease modulator HflC [Holosporales bacterium]|jgi:membrane protease subunit HflC|nr:protease modulator HflC [Holosporales bacterium]
MRNKLGQPYIVAAILCLAVVVGLFGSIFVVRQIDQALIVRFGNPIRLVNSAGLHFKLPFMIDEAIFFEKRLLAIDMAELEVTLGDRRRLVVDAFGRYRIVDPLKFYQTVRNESGLQRRLTTVVLGSLRSVLGNANVATILSDSRSKVMDSLCQEVNKAAKDFGVDILDMRIRRMDLPRENTEAICKRMISEREREAKQLRAEGAEKAQIIRAEADKSKAEKIAEANREADILIGKGEAESGKIYAQAYSKDPAFFEFYRSMQAYAKAFLPDNTKIILSPDGGFFKFFNHIVTKD